MKHYNYLFKQVQRAYGTHILVTYNSGVKVTPKVLKYIGKGKQFCFLKIALELSSDIERILIFPHVRLSEFMAEA